MPNSAILAGASGTMKVFFGKQLQPYNPINLSSAH